MSLESTIALAEAQMTAMQEEADKLTSEAVRLTALADQKAATVHVVSVVVGKMRALRDAAADLPDLVRTDLRLDHLFAPPAVFVPADLDLSDIQDEPGNVVVMPTRPEIMRIEDAADAHDLPALVADEPVCENSQTASEPDPITPAPASEIGQKIMELFHRASNDGHVLYDTAALAKLVDVTTVRLDKELTALCEAGWLLRRKSLPGHVTFEILDPSEAA